AGELLYLSKLPVRGPEPPQLLVTDGDVEHRADPWLRLLRPLEQWERLGELALLHHRAALGEELHRVARLCAGRLRPEQRNRDGDRDEGETQEWSHVSPSGWWRSRTSRLASPMVWCSRVPASASTLREPHSC